MCLHLHNRRCELKDGFYMAFFLGIKYTALSLGFHTFIGKCFYVHQRRCSLREGFSTLSFLWVGWLAHRTKRTHGADGLASGKQELSREAPWAHALFSLGVRLGPISQVGTQAQMEMLPSWASFTACFFQVPVSTERSKHPGSSSGSFGSQERSPRRCLLRGPVLLRLYAENRFPRLSPHGTR